jgi:hypothetical protein
MDTNSVNNRRKTSNPIRINLPDGRNITSTHECDVTIPGLPTVLTGHIVPHLTVASLIGIRVLCNHGCEVLFTNKTCEVYYKHNLILTGYKDPATDLWTLPLNTRDTKEGKPRDVIKNPLPLTTLPVTEKINFTHSTNCKTNAVKFAHQSLCNPPLSTLLKAIRAGFLDGCPNITEKLVVKYLPPSTATAKGHMKKPPKGVRSTSRTTVTTIPNIAQRPLPLFPTTDIVANVICCGAFADKHSGVVYSDLTGAFLFVSINGNVCFFIMYHYEANAIMAEPIAGFDDASILAAYEKTFASLKTNGFTPKINVADNQA